ncbi:hypothetical protein OESDEN_04933 [Oesophagostomum dentatum]|uniref:Uncharacterized protein n=1 Tax=Oesophagostomum dentatum TaxID=61180 RepID=A0A0B1TIC7_OESDE|nr:hypothetical protein OESDEN_04933 [Oesophagostomum dentatum]
MVCATLVSGLAPLKVLRYLRYSAAHASSSKQHRNVSLILCLLTCFSGGVFLATCFLHLFPELVENVRNLDEVKVQSCFYCYKLVAFIPSELKKLSIVVLKSREFNSWRFSSVNCPPTRLENRPFSRKWQETRFSCFPQMSFKRKHL